MVSVGFLTTPGGAARTVRLCWTRNNRPQAPIWGRPLATGRDHDRWLVELGVVEAGDVVEYWIEAESEEARCESPRHSFAVRRLLMPAAFGLIEQSEDEIRLGAIGVDGRPGPDLTLRRLPIVNELQIVLEESASWEEALPMPVTLRAGAAALTVEPDGRLTFAAGEERVPLHLRWLEEGDGSLAALELTGGLEGREAIVGLGERFDALDQRGRAPDITVYEQYKNQGDRTYLPIPFFCSSRGYGCLVEGTAHVVYDFGRTAPDRWRCMAHAGGGAVALDFFAGKPLECVRNLTALTGRPVDAPPAWAFGPWMSSNEWNTQERIEREVALTQEHGIPATVLVIEAWSDEATFYIWNGARAEPRAGDWVPRLADFEFPARGPWPDPKGMTDSLLANGIRLILWQIPALKETDTPHAQHDADRAYALEQGYVLRMSDGAPYRNPAFWFHDALIPDFTSERATDWWLAKRAYLLDEIGVAGFKTDGGEHLQGNSIVASDGRRGDELVNAYPTLYIGAYHRFAAERRNGDALTFSRAGHTGAGAFPAHWAGDENSTWEAYRRSIIAGLSAGISGIPFWGWDLAGFSDELPTAELYLRAAGMAAFCPIMQYHSEYTPPGHPSKDRTPWHIQEQTGNPLVSPLYRFFARLRMNLLPYLLREAAFCAASGEPMLRALLLDHPEDPVAWRVADQYRLGRDLLVAPIVEEGAATRCLYLPSGVWYDFWSGVPHEGGRWLEMDAPLDRLPVFVRAGAILPLNLGAGGALGDDVGNAVEPAALTLRLYPAGRSESTLLIGGETHRVIMEEGEGSVRLTLPLLPIPCRLLLPDGRAAVAPPGTEEQGFVPV